MFEEVASLDADNCTAIGGVNKQTKKPNPTSAEGYYLGSRKIDSRKSKTGYAYLHILQTSKGNLGVWGKTDLDRKLLSVTPGMMTRITFDGMRATPNGDMYKYKVAVDKSNIIEVSESLSSSAVSEQPGTEDTYGEDDNTSEDFNSDDAADDSTELIAAQEAKRKKVQDLLSNRKKA